MTEEKTQVTHRNLVEQKAAFDRLGELKLPITVALAIARSAKKVDDSLAPFFKVRDGILKNYKVTRQVEGMAAVLKPAKAGDGEKFTEEWNELLDQSVEITILKFPLPEKIAATCDKCKHNMDKVLEIEPGILLNLIDYIDVK